MDPNSSRGGSAEINLYVVARPTDPPTYFLAQDPGDGDSYMKKGGKGQIFATKRNHPTSVSFRIADSLGRGLVFMDDTHGPIAIAEGSNPKNCPKTDIRRVPPADSRCRSTAARRRHSSFSAPMPMAGRRTMSSI
jgi:hypothetical protein